MQRLFFPLIVTGALLAAAACSREKDAPETTAPIDDVDADTRPPTPPEWDRAVDRPDDEAAAASRASCKYTAGSLAAETLGKSAPVGDDIPIKNVIVLMQENRSFDSYFGHLNKFAKRTDIESAPDT